MNGRRPRGQRLALPGQHFGGDRARRRRRRAATAARTTTRSVVRNSRSGLGAPGSPLRSAWNAARGAGRARTSAWRRARVAPLRSGTVTGSSQRSTTSPLAPCALKRTVHVAGRHLHAGHAGAVGGRARPRPVPSAAPSSLRASMRSRSGRSRKPAHRLPHRHQRRSAPSAPGAKPVVTCATRSSCRACSLVSAPDTAGSSGCDRHRRQLFQRSAPSSPCGPRSGRRAASPSPRAGGTCRRSARASARSRSGSGGWRRG